jgi:hypothetical protein
MSAAKLAGTCFGVSSTDVLAGLSVTLEHAESNESDSTVARAGLGNTI